jgi:hypothetical protein
MNNSSPHLLPPELLVKLVPFYHEKKADLYQMFFRMNNIPVFEACRVVRNNFKSFVKTETFKKKFKDTFFSNNGSEFMFQSYNVLSLHVMINVASGILNQLMDVRMPLAFGGSKSRRNGRKNKKTRKNEMHSFWANVWRLQKGGVTNNIVPFSTRNSQNRDASLVDDFLKVFPYNGLLGTYGQVQVNQFLFNAVLTPSVQEEMLGRPNELLCLGYIFLFVQHVVPSMIPFELFENQLVIQNGGTKAWLKRAFVGLAAIAPNAMSFIFADSMKDDEINATNNALKSPLSSNATQMVAMFDAGHNVFVADAFAPSISKPSIKPTTFKPSIKPATSKPSISPTTTTTITPTTTTTIRPTPAATPTPAPPKVPMEGSCFLKKNIPPIPENALTGFITKDTIAVTRAAHTLSAVTESVGEFSFVMNLSETGGLAPNATVVTSHKANTTAVPGVSHVFPKNAVSIWHLHPFTHDIRYISHFSDTDLKGLLIQTIYYGITYQMAHAPEGLYIYSLKKSTLLALKKIIIDNVADFNTANNLLKKTIDQYKTLIDAQYRSVLKCEDIKTGLITSFDELGEITVIMDSKAGKPAQTIVIPLGFEIRFYNQESLSNQEKISLENHNLWNDGLEKMYSDKLFRLVGAKVDNMPGMTGDQFWNYLVHDTFSTKRVKTSNNGTINVLKTKLPALTFPSNTSHLNEHKKNKLSKHFGQQALLFANASQSSSNFKIWQNIKKEMLAEKSRKLSSKLPKSSESSESNNLQAVSESSELEEPSDNNETELRYKQLADATALAYELGRATSKDNYESGLKYLQYTLKMQEIADALALDNPSQYSDYLARRSQSDAVEIPALLPVNAPNIYADILARPNTNEEQSYIGLYNGQLHGFNEPAMLSESLASQMPAAFDFV